MPKVIIIGSGPAGVSASLYARRSNLEVTVISNGGGALLKAKEIENYYGFSDTVSGANLYYNGIEGAKRLGVEFIENEVVSLSYSGQFTVKTTSASYTADGVILATGTSRLAPKIEGLESFEGKGVSYCAVCDGFFFRNRAVGVLGSGEYALNEVRELLNITSNITVFTNGEAPTVDFPENVKVFTEKISKLQGEMLLGSILLENGEEISLNGLFVAYKTAGSTALAKKVGATTEGNKITVNENMQTNVNGLFACGDCTGGLLQIAKAVYEGAVAGTQIAKYLKEK